MAGLAGVLAIGPLSGPAWAKSSYQLTIREQEVTVGQEIHVTVELGDDAGIGTSRMCLFQMVGDHLPPLNEYGYYPTLVTDKYRKVADCRRPAPDDTIGDSGTSQFVLRATAPGRLTLVAFRDDNGLQQTLPDAGLPKEYIGTQPATITVRNPRTTVEPNATVSLVRVEKPTPLPTPPPAATPDSTTPNSDETTDPPLNATPSTDRPSWLLLDAVMAGSLLLGGAVTGVVVARRTRRSITPD
jgi:hypothetical protein